MTKVGKQNASPLAVGIGLNTYIGSKVWPPIVPRLFPKHGSRPTLEVSHRLDISTTKKQISVSTRSIQNMRNQARTETPHSLAW